jgi:hypothetical protein
MNRKLAVCSVFVEFEWRYATLVAAANGAASGLESLCVKAVGGSESPTSVGDNGRIQVSELFTL